MNLRNVNFRLVLLILFSLLAIGIRLEIENHSMNDPSVRKLIDSGATYESILVVKSDPVNSNFQVSFVAIDRVLHHRVHVVGSSEMTNVLAGLMVGDEISVQGYLSELNEYQKYKKREHIVGIFKTLEISNINNAQNFIDNSTQKMRDTIEQGCSRLEPDERGVCEGLLIGKRNSISKELYDVYRQSQLTHLLVASGANIAFLVGFLNPILSNFGRKFSSTSLVLIALFYCAATRFEPSILRASVMVIIPTVLSLNGYGVSKSKVFVFTLLVCAIIDPFLLFRVGFWLSLCATGGLFFVAPQMRSLCKFEIVRNTLAATLCVQPILWLVFGFQMPVRWWVSVIAVGIAEPLTTIGMVLVSVLSFVDPASAISQLGIIPIQVGCRSINFMAKLGASNEGYWIGWAMTALLIIAYTIRYIKNRSNSPKDNYFNGRITGLLHNRR